MSYRIAIPSGYIYLSKTPVDNAKDIKLPSYIMSYLLEAIDELPESSINTMGLINLWNEFAIKHKWVRSTRQTLKLLKDIDKAIKNLPERDEWIGVLTAMAANEYFGGKKFKPSIKILFSNDRYMEFYDLHMAKQEGVLDRSLDEIFADLEAQIATVTVESLGLC